jgi:tetratricopeptide (TPR) repeat protein/DNA-binding winged helix-turn-helix (wHTH) protein
MKILGKQVYRFEGVEMDPSQGCLRRDGIELPLRQKSVQALLYLLEERHRLVTKDELIERVWEGIAVSDDALVQLIKEIRQSLGDDPRQPRYIKTVPKAGYRFIAPVEELYQTLPAAVEIERHSSFEIEYEEEITEGEIPVEKPGNKETEKGEGSWISLVFQSPGRRVLLLTAAVVLLVVGVLTTFLLIRSDRRSAQLAELTLPTLPGRKPLAVMYFENQSGSADLDWLREGLADMLITNLSRSKRLNVLSRQQLYLLLERGGHRQTEAIRLDDALEIARKTRAEVVVLGSFARLGEKIRIDVNLHNAQSGQSLGSQSIVADKPEDILSQLDLLSLKLVGQLAEGPEAAANPPRFERVMTNDLEAYRLYSLAVEKTQALHNAEAIQLLERAIILDPKFAMAHARIGYAYGVTGNSVTKAKPHLETAFRLSDRLTEADRLHIKAWYSIVNLDYSAAISAFEEIIVADPMETEAYVRLSHLLSGEDRLEDAVKVGLRGLAVDPENPALLNHLGGFYSVLGRHDEAVAMGRRYVALAATEPNAYDTLGSIYQWAGRYQEAINEYNHALDLNPKFEVAVVHLANTYFQVGRYREAMEQYRRYIEIAPSDVERGRGFDCLSQVYWRLGELNRSEEAARKALTFDKASLWPLIVLSLERRDLKGAEELQKQYFAERSPADRGRRGTLRFYHYYRGFIDARTGHPAEAVEHFKEVLRHSPAAWAIESYEDCLANAYLDLGRLDEAIAEYERILRLNPNFPMAQYHLGQAYERKGLADQARAAYERFLQTWKDADANVPEVIGARKVLAHSS